MTNYQLIERNNEMRSGLNEINRKFYDDFVLYARSSNWLKSENAIEEQLLIILQDILEAQANGQSAADYFGKQPKEVADSLIKSLPYEIKSLIFDWFCYFFFGYYAAAFIPGISFLSGRYFLAGFALTIFSCFVLWFVGKTIYRFPKTISPKLGKAILVIMIIFLILFPWH